MGSVRPIEEGVPSILAAPYSSLDDSKVCLCRWLSFLETEKARLHLSKDSVLMTQSVAHHLIHPDGDLGVKQRQIKLLRTLSGSLCQEMRFNAESEAYFEWLASRGYRKLAQILKTHVDYPWKGIKQVSSPLLMEQLVSLHALCQHKDKDATEPALSVKAMDFALTLAQMSMSIAHTQATTAAACFDEAKQVIGQLIYLVNSDPLEASQCLSSGNLEVIKHKIQEAFHERMQRLCQEVIACHGAHEAVPLQSADGAMQTFLPVKLAQTLITDTGTLNVGIIGLLGRVFLSNGKPKTSSEVNLCYALKLLQHSPKLREELEAVEAPRHANMPSQTVIRVALGLDREAPVTAVHARQAVLAALLSHLRQDDAGSCFATSLAIEMLSSHLGWCLKDFRSVVEQSKLVRHVEGFRQDIPFLCRICDRTLHKPLILDKEGFVIADKGSHQPVWMAPGIRAACRIIGIADPKAAVEALIKKHLHGSSWQTTGGEVLRRLAEQVCQDPAQLAVLVSQACFAFSAQTASPLLKVWENAIAGMAEVHEEGMIRKFILQATAQALEMKLEMLAVSPELRAALLQKIRQHFHQRIQLRYDPTLGQELEIQGKPGGFLLYDRYHRADSPDKFSAFVEDIILAAVQDAGGKGEWRVELDRLAVPLLAYADSVEFLRQVLLAYHPGNRARMEFNVSHQADFTKDALLFTPWITRAGNNSRTVLEVYVEAGHSLEVKKLPPGGAESRLTHLIEMGKQLAEADKEAYRKNTHKLIQLRIPGNHTGSLMLGHPSLALAWESQVPVQDWIQRFVLAPGREVANSKMKGSLRVQLLKMLREGILQYVPEASWKSFVAAADKAPLSLTICQYRAYLLQQLAKASDLDIDSVARQVDTNICQLLDPKLKKKLAEATVHFADTNWSKESLDLHLGFTVNPGTGQLELWEVDESGENLTALDQKQWLYDHEWELLEIPQHLVPDDDVRL